MHWSLVPPSEVFWAPEDIKQAQRRQLEADTLTHDEVAHDHLQITIEKKLANECGMCQGRAGIYHCGSCHQWSHEIDGLLHVRLPAGHRVSIYKTWVKFYKARLSYEENITMQKRRLNQELRRRNEERRRIDKAAA